MQRCIHCALLIYADDRRCAHCGDRQKPRRRAGIFKYILPALSLLCIATGASAHSFYDAECCSGIDCAPAEQVIMLSPDLMQVTTAHGTTVIPASMKRRESKDHRLHACMRNMPDGKDGKTYMVPLCVYIPNGM